MTKIIYDAVSTMEMYRRKINGHKEKIEALEHEMACLDKAKRQHQAECRRQRTAIANAEDKLRQHRKGDTKDWKPYSKGTAASRAREASVATRRPRQESNTCVASRSLPTLDLHSPLPGFMKSTVASRARKADSSAPRSWADKDDLREEDWQSPESVDSGWGGELEPDYAETEFDDHSSPKSDHWSEEEWHLMLQTRLGKRYVLTQWADDRWLSGRYGAVRLRSRFVKNILREALELAAEIWYAWCCVHRPDFIEYEAPEGPWDLHLDRQSLIQNGVGIYPNGKLSGCHFEGVPQAQRLTHLVFNCFGGGLRNELCHFGSKRSWPSSVHWLVYPVLEFAMEVGDYPRAQKAVLLLQKLRAEAVETYAEIERMFLLSNLPEARTWELEHHQIMTFSKVLRGLEFYPDFWATLHVDQPSKERLAKLLEWEKQQYGPALVLAALQYRGQRRAVRALGLEAHGWSMSWKERVYNPQEALGFAWDADCPRFLHDWKYWHVYSPWKRQQAFSLKRRAGSVCGADIEGMDKSFEAPKNSRWKCRRDPRINLNWLDLALNF